ncbi:tRNA modification GTPase MnmE [Caulifigura coniformis]|uniref:tRNA modification GTPase MnmE n=1 Tax=Caulifigura coniformis TaxID=2527983 RepID=A0A517SBX2_9PLAN|nr:tRNA modification GTPase [Caulifigura coniformis]QDT53615.1 tRNA modification GTPase MnmE [Caulifigura coniformis]
MWLLDDVIAAVASAPGPGRRGIVRASGPGVQSVVAGMVPVSDGALHFGRATRFEALLQVDGLSTPLPAAVCVWPDHRSYTGQPTIEIHTIGSPPILNAIVQDLVDRGARVACPGEFTLRAFLAGKIDLVQAEAVLGVIDADSTTQLQQALTQLAGGVSAHMRALREQLLIDLADLEAGLDFVEEDIEFVDREAMTARLNQAVEWLSQLKEHSRARGQTTGRKSVVLAGLPNAGKSTLFNALIGRSAAVVSPVAGTTRDWLIAPIEFDGVPIELVDTAGAEEGTDAISSDAQRARRERLEQADLILWCIAADATAEEHHQDHAVRQTFVARHRELLEVTTKIDLAPERGRGALSVSVAGGVGLNQLRTLLRARLATGGDRGELLSTTLARCTESLDLASEALERAAEFSRSRGGEELVAFELRRGLESLGEIAGVVYTDDLLDRIFSRFCIGK